MLKKQTGNQNGLIRCFCLFCWVILTLQIAEAQNPIVRDIYTADPSAHVWSDGRLYIYPSHDIDPPRGCDLMDQYHVYSTDDMVNWTDHGEILRASQVSWGRSEGGFMWAPDCAYKNGTYYFYFPHPSGTDWGTTWKIGVATSTNPASDFTVQGYIPGLESMIDPCVFVDDDGQVYFYYGGGGTCKGGKLKENMTEVDGYMQSMTGLQDFHEATWVHKRNGVYYLSYSDNNSKGGNQMRYATSNKPLGPWTYQGVYMDPTGSATNHGSIVEFKGQWYAFYHNSALSGNDWLRSVCVDSLFYNENGTIQKVKQTRKHGTPFRDSPLAIPGTIEIEDFDKGGQGVAYSDNDKTNNGNQYRVDESVDIETCSSGGYNVGWTNGGEWLEYTVQVSEAGYYAARFVVASPNGNAKVHLSVDTKDITGSINISSTGGWQTYDQVAKNGIYLTQGTHILQFFEETGGLNIDKIIFEKDTQTGTKTTNNQPQEIQLFPNPATNLITVQLTGDIRSSATIRIYNMLGREVMTRVVKPDCNENIDIAALSPGSYLVGIEAGTIFKKAKLIIN